MSGHSFTPDRATFVAAGILRWRRAGIPDRACDLWTRRVRVDPDPFDAGSLGLARSQEQHQRNSEFQHAHGDAFRTGC